MTLDANALERMAKARPDECFLKGSGVLKLIRAIRRLEAEARTPRDAMPEKAEPPSADAHETVSSIYRALSRGNNREAQELARHYLSAARCEACSGTGLDCGVTDEPNRDQCEPCKGTGWADGVARDGYVCAQGAPA